MNNILIVLGEIEAKITNLEPLSKQLLTALVWFLIFLVLVKVIDWRMKQIEGDKLHVKFFRYVVKSILLIMQVYLVLTSLFPAIDSFLSGLVINTSLLVVVIGFATQESIGNIIHGLCISIFRPFQKGDHVKINNIAGIVETITLRHTVIRTYTNTRLIIPNTEADKAILENTPVTSEKIANFIDIYLAHGADVEKAIRLIRDVAESHPLVIDTRSEESKDSSMVTVVLREFAPYYLVVRATIWTKTRDDNFVVCSDLRIAIEKILKKNKISTPKSITIS